MNVRLCLLVCCLALMGCVSESQVVREPGGPVEVLQSPEAERAEAPSVFLPGELLEWEHWDAEAVDAAGWNVSYIEGEREGEVELVRARRPQYRGGRGRLGGRRQPPLLNPRPTRDEIAARRRQAEEFRLVQQARERYYQALAEARARYPNHQGHHEHHFIPIYLGGPKSGATYRLHSAYHQVITQEFRRQWPYGQGQPRPERLQQILLEVYSRYPIPQLIGISP